MTGTDRQPQLPLPRGGVLDIAPKYRTLRRAAPLTKVTTSTGDPAWVVTSYREARQIISDGARFGISVDPESDGPNPVSANPFKRDIARMLKDYERHIARLRALSAPLFSPKRLRTLAGRIQQLTDRCLDDMSAAHDRNPEQPINFHHLVGYPLPARVICALIGIPETDYDFVVDLSERMGSTGDGAGAMAANSKLREYAARLVAAKRTARGTDLVSHLLTVQDSDPEALSDVDLAYYAIGLLAPGHETTTARLDFGLLYLLSEPAHWEWLAAEVDARLNTAVEEILRMTAPHHTGLTRYATEDVEIGGVTVARGDLLIISEAAANRDPSVFDDPDVFNPARVPNNHIAFGHGPHLCIGQNLARTELRIVLRSLLRRFPDLRLAGDVRELEILHSRVGGGVDSVLVTW